MDGLQIEPEPRIALCQSHPDRILTDLSTETIRNATGSTNGKDFPGPGSGVLAPMIHLQEVQVVEVNLFDLET